jgi:hypothetical protein
MGGSDDNDDDETLFVLVAVAPTTKLAIPCSFVHLDGNCFAKSNKSIVLLLNLLQSIVDRIRSDYY